MRWNRVLLAIGGVILLLLLALVGLAIFLLEREKKEKGRLMIKPASDKRWPKKDPAQESVIQPPGPDPEMKLDKPVPTDEPNEDIIQSS